MIRRRSLLIGAFASLLAAPSIVRASNLMSVKPYPRTAKALGLISIDGHGLTVGDEILVTYQSSGIENGVYIVKNITSSSYELASSD